MTSYTPQVKRISQPKEKTPSIKAIGQLIKQELYDEALAAVEAILKEDPNSKQAYIGLGSIYLKQKDFDLALNSFQTARRLDPLMVKPALAVGSIHLKQNCLEEAAEAFRDAINIDPTSFKGNLGIARVLLKQGKYDLAGDQIHRALTLNPQSAQARLLLAQILQKEGNLVQAIAELNSALTINPNAWIIYQALGNLYIESRQYKEAKQAYQKAFKFNPKLPAAAKMGYVEALIEDNCLDEAEQILRELPGKKTIEAKKQKYLGDIFQKKGFFKEAAEAYRAASLLANQGEELTEDFLSLDSLIAENQDQLADLLEDYQQTAKDRLAQRALRKNL
jgi:tetratricopeptide (TPR) repeat protein